MPSNGLYMEDV